MTATATRSIIDSARAIQDWIVMRRRFLHQRPELSYQEQDTSGFVAKELASLGFTTIEKNLNGNYSICAELLGRNRDRVVALRGDMDALPIQEETESEYKSQRDGVAHMCGHDAHTAMLLGAARLLKEREAELPCTVRFFFQGGEEMFPGGANDFIKTGKLDDVDAIYGLHVDPRTDTGTLQLIEGNALAGTSELTIRVYGKGGHAAFPHMAVDPVLASAQIITALQQIVSRTEDPFSQAVVSITQLDAGHAFNVIPEEVRLCGTIRSFRSDMHEHYNALIHRIVENTAAAHGCRAEIDLPPGYPPLYNNPTEVERVRRVAGGIFGDGVSDAEPIMGAEDFALYSQKVPACFAFLGVSDPAETERYMLHHPKFHIVEEPLWRGSALLASMVFNQE